ncbi:MAG: glycosyltransferase [Methanoregula sp.]|jgi:glycosyltransferase involved in cell wall biosynthesis|uniref:glycosyltransferase n=1 Tax=Methanoregula sp. TaxID=2052170 RepID=UPI003C195D5C
MPSPKITVLMSVFNGEKYLREAVESILGQTYTDFEFLIIDDASMDSSSEILRQYADPRIRLINNEKNLGLTKSLNMGIALAEGEYIARMDADDISLPDRFEKQIAFLERTPEIALLGTSNYFIDENGKKTGMQIVRKNPSFDLLCNENQFNHGSIIVKKSVVRNLGGYNENFRYVQDFELWLRIAKEFPVRNLVEPLYKLRMHNENIGHLKSEESALYFLFAVKLNTGRIDQKTIDIIKNNGIRYLMPHLTKKEMVYYYDSLANMYIRNGDFKKGREQYKQIFRISPLNVANTYRYFRSFFGIRFIKMTYNLYLYISNKGAELIS